MKAAVLEANHPIDARRSTRIEITSSVAWSRLSGVGLFAALAGLLAVSAWQAPGGLKFKDFGVTEVGHLLTTLFVVALLAERALEIFVGTWRSPRALELDLAVENQGKGHADAQAHGDRRTIDEAKAKLDAARREVLNYRCGTRQVALWAGLVLGFLVSGVGVRAIGTLIEPVGTWTTVQHTAFRLVDGLLTGGVIAGGSEGIHRLATVFDNFMTTAAKRAKAAA